MSFNYDTTEDPQDKQYKRNAVRDDLVNKFYSTSETAPVLDQAKVDRLQRMGRINSLGRGVNVLGDVLGTALGATVRRRQPDNISPMLYNTFQNTLDKYETDKKAYDYRGYGKKLQNISTAIGNEDYNSQRETAFKNHQDALKAASEKNKMDWTKYMAGLSQEERQMAETSDYHKKMVGLGYGKLELEKDKLDAVNDKPFDPVQVRDKQGNLVKLPQGDWDNLYQDAMRDPNFLTENMKAEISKYKELPDGGIKQIARAYHDYKLYNESMAEMNTPQFKQGQQAAEDLHRKEKGLPTGPASKSWIQNQPIITDLHKNDAPAPIKQPSGKFTIGGKAVTKPMF